MRRVDTGGNWMLAALCTAGRERYQRRWCGRGPNMALWKIRFPTIVNDFQRFPTLENVGNSIPNYIQRFPTFSNGFRRFQHLAGCGNRCRGVWPCVALAVLSIVMRAA